MAFAKLNEKNDICIKCFSWFNLITRFNCCFAYFFMNEICWYTKKGLQTSEKKKEEKLKTFLNFLLSINSKNKVLFVAHFSAWLLKISLWYHWIQWWRYFQWLPQSSPDIPLNFKTPSFSSYCSKLKVMFSLWWFIFPVISATWFLFS